MMSKSVVSRGKDVKEAVNIGLNLLNTTKKFVDIEIISPERKGILGIGSKPAVVKLMVKSSMNETLEVMIQDNFTSTDNIELESTYKNNKHVQLEGKVWIEDGKIYSRNSADHYPTITPSQGMVLYKNGEALHGTSVVTENDMIEVEFPSEMTKTTWEITIDEHKLYATLHVKPGKEMIRKLQDHDPIEHLELRASESVTICNHLKPEEVISQLTSLGVTYGINYSNIFAACETKLEGDFTIASGLETQNGTNGYVEYFVGLNDGIRLFNETEKSVDFREIRHIPSVKKGDVIAKNHKPVLGIAGITITGEPIAPNPVFPVSVQFGKGAALIEEDMAIVAISSGRPQVQSRGLLIKISVLPKLFHDKDVDLSTGNIRFTGDVEVTGEIQEEMELTAQGSVIVHGIVNRAKVTAGNSILMKNNVIGSEISAGNSNMATSEAKRTLGNIVPQLKDIILAIKQLYRSPAFKMSDFSKMGMSSLIKILLESKFEIFNSVVKEFVINISMRDHMFDEEWKLLSDRLYKSFLILHPHELRDISDLERLMNDAEELFQISQCPSVPNCSLTILYALNSKLFSSGDVIVTGQGCYHTKIHAEGLLKISGFLRGGEAYAEAGVEIGEAGANGGVATKIMVGHSQTIIINKVYEDTTIMIGKKQYKFTSPRENVKVRLDHNERFEFF